MRTKPIAFAACLIALCVIAPSGAAEQTGSGDVASKACQAEKKADKDAFKEHWGKHAMRECKRALRGELAGEAKNAAKECKAEREADPVAFVDTYATNENGKNAFGMCVSTKVHEPEEGPTPAPTRGAGNADLSVDKSDSADPVAVGAQLTYSIQVANSGPATASGVTLEDELPNKVDFASVTPSTGSCDQNGKKVSCALGQLAAGAGATVEIRVLPRAEGQFVNTATVSSAAADPVAANNADTETTTVIAAPSAATCGGAEAAIVGTAGDDVLVGTDKRDVIAALGGNDQVRALGGKDIVCGFGGADKLKGQGADDALRGGGGNDRLGGGGGDDLLRGGTGDDRCRGGPGADIKRSC